MREGAFVSSDSVWISRREKVRSFLQILCRYAEEGSSNSSNLVFYAQSTTTVVSGQCRGENVCSVHQILCGSVEERCVLHSSDSAVWI